MGQLEGTISVTGLPPHRGLIVNLCFYRVGAADAPKPYGGDPPASAATDLHKVAEQVDLNTESLQPAYELPFAVDRPVGFYYLQVRAILFRLNGVEVFAQAEQFFYGRRPIEITERSISVTLPVVWPTQTPDQLHVYGVVKPKGNES